MNNTSVITAALQHQVAACDVASGVSPALDCVAIKIENVFRDLGPGSVADIDAISRRSVFGGGMLVMMNVVTKDSNLVGPRKAATRPGIRNSGHSLPGRAGICL